MMPPREFKIAGLSVVESAVVPDGEVRFVTPPPTPDGVSGATRELLDAARQAQRALTSPRPSEAARDAASARLGPAIARLEAALLGELLDKARER